VRLRARVDANQAEIVQALRDAGRSVLILSSVGKGCPDILVGYPGGCTLMEIKDGAKSASRRKLTPDEEQFRARWRGPYAVVTSVAEALAATGAKVAA
jgi:Holliday junction resolvase